MPEPRRRFDHLVIAVRDLERAAARYRELGFDVRPGGRHPGRGTENAIVRFGHDYLELISVYDHVGAERAGRGELVDFLRRGEGFVAYALETSDIDAEAERLHAAGTSAVGPFPMERHRPDGSRLSWRLVVPGDTQYRRPWPFFIQWDQPEPERLVTEASGQHANGARRVSVVSVAVADLARAIGLYARTLRLELVERGEERDLAAWSATFALGGSQVRLLAPAGPGPLASALAAAGEGPFEAVLAAPDLHEPEVLLDPDTALGARLLLRREPP